MVNSIVGVSEFEWRHLALSAPDIETWYDPERHQLMRSTDQYGRSLSLVGWLFGRDLSHSDIVAGVWWREWTKQGQNDRTLAGIGWIRQRSERCVNTRWLWILTPYIQDQYQQGDLFAAFVWQRSWSL